MKFFFTLIVFLLFTSQNLISQGKILIVLGSDTAIWNGMDVAKYHCFYNFDLFTSPSSNTSVVMNPTFRNQILDSYGNKLKMTWWMIGGNMFRYAVNNNVPVRNTMALYLMKKYFGDKIDLLGDELSLHYHTFGWTDYDKDGRYWWNQTLSFNETRKDFDLTLAQFLLEENVFPVSFRSGWHYMDNDWQNYLNKLLPYSLHNDWPAKRYNLTEPINNLFDWSQAPSGFIPFHPSEDNYQLPGNGKGWNVRSKYMGSVNTQLVTDIFEKADQGIDQVVCFWSHLPDANFINEINQVNDILHQVSSSYPEINFKYCTAIEAYQLWLESSDTTRPSLNIEEVITGTDIKFIVTTDEKIFQEQPFLAVKDIYENYFIAEFENTSTNTWRTVNSYSSNIIGKVGAAVTDTVGNLSTSFIKYLPDDQFIDDDNSAYQEIMGSWSNSSLSSWGLDSRKAQLNAGDSAKVKWNFNIDKSGLYNIFIQLPETENLPDTISFIISGGGLSTDTTFLKDNYEPNEWLFVNTANFTEGENNFIEMFAVNRSGNVKIMPADVVKLSAYVREVQLIPDQLFVDLNEVSIEDTVSFELQLSNIGLNALNISSVSSVEGNIDIGINLPLVIEGMSVYTLPLKFIPPAIGNIEDTLLIHSNDPSNPFYRIPLSAKVQNYFEIIDNEEFESYNETGEWFTSVTQAYGNSSRYAFISSSGGASAAFNFNLKKSGYYDIFEIVPITVNSADNALYELSIDGVIKDSVYINQNEGSGFWKLIGRYYLPASTPVILRVIDSGESTAGPVIRADAIKLALFEESTNVNEQADNLYPEAFLLLQNYPNPFNPVTKIRYAIPVVNQNGAGVFVSLKVYDILGNEVTTLVNKEQQAGEYEVTFDGSGVSSGIYFYKITAGKFSKIKKLVLLK
jgi:hypothetical protein